MQTLDANDEMIANLDEHSVDTHYVFVYQLYITCWIC